MIDRVPMTQDGYNKIQAEADHLEAVDMPAIADRIALARAEGDLKENAEYHAQREAQGLLQAKINHLRSKLSRAILLTRPAFPKTKLLSEQRSKFSMSIWKRPKKSPWWAKAMKTMTTADI